MSLAACSHVNVRATRLNPQTPVTVRTLAVVPFDNLTASPEAGGSLTAVIVNELRQIGGFRLVDVDRNIVGGSERWTAAKLGTELKVDAVLVGVVTAYEYVALPRGGQTGSPCIAVDLRVVAAGSGEVLWAAGVDARLLHIFSSDGMPIETLAQEVAGRVAKALSDLQAGS